MDSRQSGSYQPPIQGYPYQYTQHQQERHSNNQNLPQLPQYQSNSQMRNGYGQPLQSIDTYQSMYAQPDSMRNSSTGSAYQQQPSSSVPISPSTYTTYSQHTAYQTAREQQSVPHPPPSPSQSEPQEEEDAMRRQAVGPPPEMHVWQGHKYGLRLVQEPIRARMCGFGDKDRRPITTPPIVQAVIYDEETGEEIDYQNCDLELSHFVVQVHIFDIEGRIEKSIVKTAPGQQIISATLASGYPSTPMNHSPSRIAPRLPLEDAAYASAHGRHPSLNGQFPPFSPSPYQYGANTAAGAMFPTAAPPPQYSPMNAQPYNIYGGFTRTMGVHQQNISTGPSQPPTPPLSKNEEAGPGYSRNLIGANTMSGQLLYDHTGNYGIFFAFTDLSVRSEDWFRLKFNLFNVGETITGLSNAQLFKMAEENNSAPSTGAGAEFGKAGSKRLDGLRAGLIAKTAPCLATVYSQAFKVYSAKKFPGVAEGTEISRTFAKQGVKISVRKESKTGDKRKRSAEDEEEDADSGED